MSLHQVTKIASSVTVNQIKCMEAQYKQFMLNDKSYGEEEVDRAGINRLLKKDLKNSAKPRA